MTSGSKFPSEFNTMMNPRCKYLIIISGVLQNIYEDVCIQIQELVDNQLKFVRQFDRQVGSAISPFSRRTCKDW